MKKSPDLVPSDGQETIRCEDCDVTIVHGNSIVLLDLCASCERREETKLARSGDGVTEDCDVS